MTASDIDTAAELAAYDVVMFGASGNGDTDHDWTTTMATAVEAWVSSGGGTVGTGWFNYNTNNSSIDQLMDDLVPIDASPSGYNYCSKSSTSPGYSFSGSNHPIADGLSDFTTGSNFIEVSDITPDEASYEIIATGTGTCDGTNNNNYAIVAGERGSGRTVYVGGLFQAAASYNNSGLRTGDEDHLIENAVAWAAAATAVDNDGDGYDVNDDCDDNDATVNPGATEIWYDGIDQNCDEWSDYDQDADGYEHIDYGGTDCDDEDATVNVAATEIWYDGVDQDCDNLSDYDADYDGQDSESYGGEDCDDADPSVYTGAPDTPYDGIITDCLNADDYDADGDGSASIDYGGDDCDDANSDVYPTAEEIWYDGIDQNCDGNDDDQDEDGYPALDDCNDVDADVNPSAEEVWYDGIDQNCDGNEYDQDEDGYDLDDDCDDEDASSYPDNGLLDLDCEPVGKAGCFSSTTGGKPIGTWALLLTGLLLIRRKSNED